MSPSLRTLGYYILVLTVFPFSPLWAADVLTPGDLNLDSVTDHDDFFQLLLDYDPWGPRLAPEADTNSDLRVDHKDIQAAILGRLLGKGAINLPEPSQSGVVKGVILEDVGDALVVIPISGATVWISTEQGFRLKTTSGPGGDFRFEGVPAGAARITASHPDYHTARIRIGVTAGQETEAILRLAPRNEDLADLSGFVRGAFSNDLSLIVPIEGAAVRLVPLGEDGIRGDFDNTHLPGQEDGHQVVFTDDQGHYVVHDLAVGKYRLVVTANGFQPEEREIEILSNESVHTEDFVLLPVVRPYGAVLGTVFSYDPRSARPMDAPLAGAKIVLRHVSVDETGISGLRYYEAVSDEQGHYLIEGVHPGRYIARAVAAFHFPATAEVEVFTQQRTTQDFHLEIILGSNGAVAGTVTGVTPGVEDPVPLEDALVSLLPKPHDATDPITWSDALVEVAKVRSVTTDEEGKYAFREVPAGDYMVIAWARGWGTATDAATVIPNETVLVNLQIIHQPPPPQTRLFGTVFGVVPGTLGLPVPLAGAHVIAIPGNSDWTERISLPGVPEKDENPGQVHPPVLRKYVTETDGNGHYEFNSLPPGSYRVIAMARGYEGIEQMAELPAGVSTQLDFYLNKISSEQGIVLGTVFTAVSTGTRPLPVEGAKVRMTNENDPSVALTLFETETNQAGYFEFAPVPVGTYKLEVTKEGFRAEQRRVWVNPGETVKLSIELFPEATGQTGMLEGHVWREIDPNTDQLPMPIKGAMVLAIPVSFSLPPSSALLGMIEVEGENNSVQSVPLITRTDENGYYRFDSVPAGSVAMVVLVEGFLPALDTTRVAVGATTVLDFYLKPMGGGQVYSSLSGVITGHTDFPTFAPVYVAGAKVTLIPQNNTDPATARDQEGQRLVAFTNQFGEYKFPRLYAGLYRMLVQADGYQDADLKVEIPAGTAVRRDLELMPLEGETGKLFGYASEAYAGGVARPVAGAIVRLIPDDIPIPAIFPPPNVGYDRSTDENGYYLFESLPPKGYQVIVLKEGYTPTQGHIDLQAGQELRADWILNPDVPPPTGRFFGYVTQPGTTNVLRPVAGAIVRLVPDGYPVIEIFPPPNVGYDRTTDENGYYLFESLPVNGYQVVVIKDGFVPTQGHIEIRPGQELRADWVLVPIEPPELGRIFGYVRKASDNAGTPGEPIAGATVRLGREYPVPGNILPPDDQDLIRKTDERGFYEFRDLAPGGYVVACTKDGYEYEVTRRDLAQGEQKQVNFFLTPIPQGPATLMGVITEDVGLLTVWIPISGASITLTGINSEMPSRTTTSGEQGDYKFVDVPPGEYQISVVAEGYQEADGSVYLPPGKTVIRNFALKPVQEEESASLFGKVLELGENGDLKPLEGATISMIAVGALAELNLPTNDGPLPPDVGYTDTSDADGSYHIGSLQPGKYLVVVWKDGYFRTREGSTHEIIELAVGDKKEKDWKLRFFTETVSAQYFGHVTERLSTGELKPLKNALVRLIPNGLGVIAVYPPPYGGFDRFTDENGYYEFDLVPQKGFYGVVIKRGYTGVGIRETHLAEGETLQKDFTLEAVVNYAKITVDVTEFTLSLRPGRLPIPNAKIKLVESDGDIRTGQTSEDGYRTFEKVTPGPYILSVTADEFVSQTHTGAVDPGAAITESFQLVRESQGPATLTGYVSRDMGPLDVWVPIEGATVSLAGVNTDEVPRITKTDADGKYVFKDVSPREYDVTAEKEGYITETERVMLHAGEEKYLNFMLEKKPVNEFGSVSGKVISFRPDGETSPAPFLSVRLLGTNGDPATNRVFERITFTDRSGVYEFDEVPPGEYELKVIVPFIEDPRAIIEVVAGEITVQDFMIDLVPDVMAVTE